MTQAQPPRFEPQTPDFAERVKESFTRQRVMHLIGAELSEVQPGLVKIRLPFREDLTQQHGFLHAGVITTIVDSACGYAAFSLMPAGASVLTVEYKLNLLAPAKGEWFLAKGVVIKPGRTVTVCEGEVYAMNGSEEDNPPKLIATMSATMITLLDRPGVTPG
ncbi:MAG: thioesterase [Bacillus thermozeamaize]|uniref:Medium/long-chain acyl-CoA thioesterase YigI n=1 Tax=Bacillus thermozeamaize TaxID=230954 RepID=A0A1Y3PSM3_9BACI|nr:MAG: thioesterase [Bacillus thermozeamaize]